MSVRNMRLELRRDCDLLQGLLAFNYRLDEASKQSLEDIRTLLPIATAKQLRDLRDQLRANLDTVRGMFGCKVRDSEFWKWMAAAALRTAKGGVVHIPKVIIDRKFFSRFGGIDEFKNIPPHAMVMVDYSGRFFTQGVVEYYLPEAVLYEDMACAYNGARVPPPDYTGYSPAAKIPIKTNAFHMRASILSAFYFVEAFLNGMAFDFLAREPRGLSDDDRELLLEWDSRRNKDRFVSTRDKLLQYPKLILGEKHPPLTETNCPELKYFVTEAKDLRDAVVHQSPKLLALGTPPEKVRLLISLQLSQVTSVVDCAVALVRKTWAVLGRDPHQIHWLKDRERDAGFPPEAFA